MVLHRLAMMLALFASIRLSTAASPARLVAPRSVASTDKTCAPSASEFLYHVHADGLSKLGFMQHKSYIKLATNLFAPGFGDSDELVWNLASVPNLEPATFRIQVADGSRCAVARGKDRKVGLASCQGEESLFVISCASCGKTSCGDPIANRCTIAPESERGQCLSRIGKLVVARECDRGDKRQKWGFNLA